MAASVRNARIEDLNAQRRTVREMMPEKRLDRPCCICGFADASTASRVSDTENERVISRKSLRRQEDEKIHDNDDVNLRHSRSKVDPTILAVRILKSNDEGL